jgi:hypothetical protein
VYDGYIMSNKAGVPAPIQMQLRVLKAIQGGAHTWGEIKAAPKISDDDLGLVLGELLTHKRVRTEMRGNVRVYRFATTRA